MTHLLAIDDTPEAEVSRPAADRLISGDPVLTTWNVEDRDGLYAGRWHATVGAWRKGCWLSATASIVDRMPAGISR